MKKPRCPKPGCDHKMKVRFQGNHDPSTWKKTTRRAARRSKSTPSKAVQGAWMIETFRGPKVVRWNRVKSPSRYRVKLACSKCGSTREFMGSNKSVVNRKMREVSGGKAKV